jgi:hypothetical protein
MKQTEISTSSGRAMRWRRMILCVIAVALVFAVPTSAAGSHHAPRDFWGVVPILEDLSEADFARMGAGNVGTMRQLVMWPAIEPSPGEYDWRYTDYLVANAAAQGVEVLPFVYGTPRWVPGVNCSGLDEQLCLRVPPVSGAPQAAWTNFLRKIVGRYGTQGTFWTDTSDEYEPPYRPITRWQIWNEPSSQTYYQPKPKARGYAKLVKASHNAIVETDPAAQIVLAGVFTAPEGGARYRIVPYMTDFFDVRGIGKFFDIAAIHPYARTANGLRKQIANLRRVMRRARVAKKPLWVTELGWSSDPPGPGPLLVGPEQQRDRLAEAFGMLAAKRQTWNLAGVFWYSWRDPGYGYANCTFCAGAGLLGADGTPKAAWHAFVAATGGTPEPPHAPEPEPPPPPPPDLLPILP